MEHDIPGAGAARRRDGASAADRARRHGGGPLLAAAGGAFSQSADWLATTVTAVRELMIKRLEAQSLSPEAKRETEMALEELDVMWEELQGQAALLLRENARYAEFFERSEERRVGKECRS